MQSAEVKQIEAFSEAVNLLHRANITNHCDWAEAKVRRAAQYLTKQQTALCEFHFLDTPTCADLRKLEDVIGTWKVRA